MATKGWQVAQGLVDPETRELNDCDPHVLADDGAWFTRNKARWLRVRAPMDGERFGVQAAWRGPLAVAVILVGRNSVVHLLITEPIGKERDDPWVLFGHDGKITKASDIRKASLKMAALGEAVDIGDRIADYIENRFEEFDREVRGNTRRMLVETELSMRWLLRREQPWLLVDRLAESHTQEFLKTAFQATPEMVERESERKCLDFACMTQTIFCWALVGRPLLAPDDAILKMAESNDDIEFPDDIPMCMPYTTTIVDVRGEYEHIGFVSACAVNDGNEWLVTLARFTNDFIWFTVPSPRSWADLRRHIDDYDSLDDALRERFALRVLALSMLSLAQSGVRSTISPQRGQPPTAITMDGIRYRHVSRPNVKTVARPMGARGPLDKSNLIAARTARRSYITTVRCGPGRTETRKVVVPQGEATRWKRLDRLAREADPTK